MAFDVLHQKLQGFPFAYDLSRHRINREYLQKDVGREDLVRVGDLARRELGLVRTSFGGLTAPAFDHGNDQVERVTGRYKWFAELAFTAWDAREEPLAGLQVPQYMRGKNYSLFENANATGAELRFDDEGRGVLAIPADVRMLFPYSKKSNRLDRPIGAFSDVKLPEERIAKIADAFANALASYAR